MREVYDPVYFTEFGYPRCYQSVQWLKKAAAGDFYSTIHSDSNGETPGYLPKTIDLSFFREDIGWHEQLNRMPTHRIFNHRELGLRVVIEWRYR